MISNSEYITITLLGLEKDLWLNVPIDEQKKYISVMYSYISFVVLALLGSMYFVYLIYASWIVAFFAGIFIAFIIASVVRFSLIILRRSIFDFQTNWQEIPSKDERQPKSKWKIPNINWRDFVNELKSVGNIQANTQIKGFDILLKFIIISMMGVLVIFPLACIFHFNRIEEINQLQANNYVNNYEADLKSKFKNKIDEINNEIGQIEKELEIYSDSKLQDGLYTDKKNEISRLKIKITEEQEDFNVNFANQLSRFKQQIYNRHFVVLSFKTVLNLPGFYLSLILVTALLIIPHLLLYRLKKGHNYFYATMSTSFYKGIIDQEYEKAEQEGYAYLLNKYDYNPVQFKKNVYWENPPYNTIARKLFTPRSVINYEEFDSSIEKSEL
jgi:hypothetical protein